MNKPEFWSTILVLLAFLIVQVELIILVRANMRMADLVGNLQETVFAMELKNVNNL